MARRPRPLSPDDGPLASFALELRALRDSCGATAPTPDDIADKEGIHRTTIYAALSGKRVPSRDVLAAIVTHWKGGQVEWATKRSALENALSTARQIQEQPDRPSEARLRAGTGVTWDELERAGITWEDLSGDGQLRSRTPENVELQRFADDLRDLIQERGLSYRAIAKLSHVSTTTIANAVRGTRLPTWETLRWILETLVDDGALRLQWQDRWVELRKMF